MGEITVFDLLPGDAVGCLYCYDETYHRGQAFLCGPEHPPYDANANYFCEMHLDAAVVSVYDPLTGRERPRQQAQNAPLSGAYFI